ncbi:MAG: transcription antitermination factor NusB [Verrucomicrobiota bacterium JB023]|nr:transcription antitermination factor NusB [Verrucomicrobiota bacterium JB023]
MPKQDKNVRRAAVSCLRAWSKGHEYADSLVEAHARRNHLSASDRGLLNAILLAVLRNRRLLDFYISKLRHGHLDHETRDILRVGLAQLLILGIPDHAAVNETVNCARAAVRGLINACMRKAVDKRKQLFSAAAELPPAEQLSHPDWLVKRWRQNFGPEEALALMEWNNEPAPTYLRLNPLQPKSADLAQDSRLSPIEGAADFFALEGPIPQEWTAEGLVYIQDPATRHSVELLAPQPGETILDACAAPGGKAALIAASMKNEGRLLCSDSNEKRLPRLSDNLSNLGVTIAAMAHFDWTGEPPKEWLGFFDGILLDVPCSNTGVLRRRVDARWRLQPAQLDELLTVQETILRNSLRCLKPEGRLVYSTCSIEPEENMDLVRKFATEEGLTIVDSIESFPQRDKVDGAFAALLRRLD